MHRDVITKKVSPGKSIAFVGTIRVRYSSSLFPEGLNNVFPSNSLVPLQA